MSLIWYGLVESFAYPSGRRRVISSFKWFLPYLPSCRGGGGGGRHPVNICTKKTIVDPALNRKLMMHLSDIPLLLFYIKTSTYVEKSSIVVGPNYIFTMFLIMSEPHKILFYQYKWVCEVVLYYLAAKLKRQRGFLQVPRFLFALGCLFIRKILRTVAEFIDPWLGG